MGDMQRQSRTETNNSLHSYVSLPGLAALGASAVLYTYSSFVSREAQELARAEPISQLSDLSKVAHLLPMLVAIRGRVNSFYAKKCELSNKHAVIHELLEEEIWRKQRAEGRTTYEPFETRKVFEECEWFVEDGSGLRVKVENALQAGHLRSAMESKTEFVAEDLTQKSIGKVLMEKAWQMTKTGVRKTERFLPVGTVVTCVGELAPNQIRTPASAAPAGTIGPSAHNPTASASTPLPSSSPHSSLCLPPSSSSSGGGGGGGDSGSSFSSSLGGSSHSSSSSGEGLHKLSKGAGHGAGQHVSMGSSGALQGGTHGSLMGGLFTSSAGVQGEGAGGEEHLAVVLRKPVSGPSYITTLSVEQLVSAMVSTARKCKWAAFALGALGAFLVTRKAILRVLQQLRERRLRARVLQAEQARRTRVAEARKARSDHAGSAPGGALGARSTSNQRDTYEESYPEEYQGDREPNTCVICLESSVGTVFTLCGHMCCCVGCGLASSMDRCPICRVRGRAIRVFRP